MKIGSWSITKAAEANQAQAQQIQAPLGAVAGGRLHAYEDPTYRATFSVEPIRNGFILVYLRGGGERTTSYLEREYAANGEELGKLIDARIVERKLGEQQ